MRKFILTVILVFTSSAYSTFYAQDVALDVNKVGGDLCKCINTMLDEFHPQIKVMLRDFDALGMEKAQENLVSYLEKNPDEAGKVMESANKMTAFDQTMESIPDCEEMRKLNASLQAMSPDFESELFDYLKSKTACEYTYIFFKMGTQ